MRRAGAARRQGNITSRSYRLPPVLWLNLDRFVYDREAQRGRKRRARLTFPDVLNVWMLVPPEERWVQELRGNAMQRTELHRRLSANRTDLAARSAKFEDIGGQGARVWRASPHRAL